VESVQECWKRLSGVRTAQLKGQFGGICKDCDVWREYKNMFWGHEFPWKK
jgi:hypothetical protein